MTKQTENGFSFHNLPAATQPARALIVVLHGFGNTPDQFVKWAKKTQAQNPEADILVLQGPIPLHASEEQKKAMRAPNADDLYSWYSLGGGAVKELTQPFNEASIVTQMNRFLDAQLKKRGLADENLALMGFSQGAMVSILTATHRTNACSAVVAHSGAALPFNTVSAKPDTLMIMGDADELFYHHGATGGPAMSRTVDAFRKAGIIAQIDHAGSRDRLRAAGLNVDEKVFAGQGHRVTEASWQAASDFVTAKLKLK